jgi:hypothetical protein
MTAKELTTILEMVGWNNVEAARRMGYSTVYMSLVTTGKRPISMQFQTKLKQALNELKINLSKCDFSA